MTICIAALAENGKKLVVAVDKMITADYPMAYEFENEDTAKIIAITGNAVALISGSTFYGSEIARSTREACLASHTDEIAGVAETARFQYQNFRRSVISQQFLEPRGLNWGLFYDYQNRLSAGVLSTLDFQMLNHNIQVEMLVVGYSGGECRIFSIVHPGMVACHDTLGYACIGSGAPHAMYHLIGSGYRRAKTEEEVRALVEAAKKKAELAPGVGNDTVLQTMSAEADDAGHTLSL